MLSFAEPLCVSELTSAHDKCHGRRLSTNIREVGQRNTKTAANGAINAQSRLSLNSQDHLLGLASALFDFRLSHIMRRQLSPVD